MALHLRDVAKTYGKGDNEFQALKPVNLSIEPGSSVAIVGKSGSGKSTLLHLMVGLDHPTAGEILFSGKNILKDYKTDAWRGENVGIIFQQFFLQPKDSVVDNVSLPLKLRGMGKRKRTAEAKDALRLVGLIDKAKNKANDLSGGQKQRVAIARAIVTKPAILVADEPTGNLDSENGEAVERLLFQLNQQLNTTLIVVTHDEDLASRCQRIVRLRDGMVVEDTAQSQTRRAPAKPSMQVGIPLQRPLPPRVAPVGVTKPVSGSAPGAVPGAKPAASAGKQSFPVPRPTAPLPKQPAGQKIYHPAMPGGAPQARVPAQPVKTPGAAWPEHGTPPAKPELTAGQEPTKPVNRTARRVIQ